MKTIVHNARSREKLLHIETEGCIVNIQVGLTDNEGRAVTSIRIGPDDETRGGDGEGRIWHIEPKDTVANIRVIREPEKEKS